MYYGGADTVVAVAGARLDDILAWLRRYGRPPA
jgi:predicted GH43/DUF377 family glycosyl hydrolase